MFVRTNKSRRTYRALYETVAAIYSPLRDGCTIVLPAIIAVCLRSPDSLLFLLCVLISARLFVTGVVLVVLCVFLEFADLLFVEEPPTVAIFVVLGARSLNSGEGSALAEVTDCAGRDSEKQGDLSDSIDIAMVLLGSGAGLAEVQLGDVPLLVGDDMRRSGPGRFLR